MGAGSNCHSDSTSMNARAQVSAAADSVHLEIVNFGRDLHHCFDQNGSCGTTAGSPDKCGIARFMACFRNVDAGLEAAGADIWAIDLPMDKDLRGKTPRKVGAKLTFRGNFRIRVGIRRLLGRSNPKQFRTRR